MKPGHYQVRHLMARPGLKARYPKRFKVTAGSNHGGAVSPNSLGRQFGAKAPNQAWATGTTCLRTLEGWLCLAVVIDLFSRRVVGWAVADHMKATLCASALPMAFLPTGHKGAENRNLACPIILVGAAKLPAMTTVNIWLS
jgi:putative transposase